MSYPGNKNRKYCIERYRNQRAYFQKVLGSRCGVCKSTKNLEFDHINPATKSFSVSKLWARKDFPKVLKELKKCQLLCRKCHKKKTLTDPFLIRKQQKKWAPHGTTSRYAHHGCRCTKCRKAQSIWKKDYRQRKGITKNTRGIYNRPAACGTTLKYTRGCRCELCKAAHAVKEKLRRQKLRAYPSWHRSSI